MKILIKEQLQLMLLENNFNISKIQSKKLVQLGLPNFGDEVKVSSFLKKNLLSIIKLPNTITLYRVVFLKNKNSLNKNEVGTHYVLKRDELEKSHQQGSHVGGGEPFILTVKAPTSLIDIYTTLENRVLFPHENEISLLNKGLGAKITNIEPFKESNFLDDDLYGDDDIYGDDTYYDDSY